MTSTSIRISLLRRSIRLKIRMDIASFYSLSCSRCELLFGGKLLQIHVLCLVSLACSSGDESNLKLGIFCGTSYLKLI